MQWILNVFYSGARRERERENNPKVMVKQTNKKVYLNKTKRRVSVQNKFDDSDKRIFRNAEFEIKEFKNLKINF